ncbi:Ig-like domain-containing protein [Saccharothrix sp. NPDC042600]|uniref:Ig-like domain-containing protein n=1 Tax=Saccharothrix TaxID=2071 RepID=UPI0033C6AFB4|nr:hypothetical protein GCM10017745_48940 [Saccharothrix mutabilis subsp. capreolus]
MNLVSVARTGLVAALVLLGSPAVPASGIAAVDPDNPPTTFTQKVTNPDTGQTITLRLCRVRLRGDGFDVRVQQADGSFATFTPKGERAYLGTVDGFPDAVASGYVMSDGTVRAQVVFDRGATWWTTGDTVAKTRGTTPPTAYTWPTTPTLAAGVLDDNTVLTDVGLDLSSDYFTTRAGSDVATALDLAEYSMNNIRAIYLTDVGVKQALGRVVIRSAPVSDPYETSAELLNVVRDEWRTNQADAGIDQVQLITVNKGGGLAFVSDYNPEWNSGRSDADSDGSFDIVARHEMGHNWGVYDNHAGAEQEGATVMSGNQYGRFSGPEAQAVGTSRAARTAILVDVGVYRATALPPYAAMDTVEPVTGPVTLNPLANDRDGNNDALTITSVQAASALGGQVVLNADQSVTYTPPAGGLGGRVDHFTYTVTDASGQIATGLVLAR